LIPLALLLALFSLTFRDGCGYEEIDFFCSDDGSEGRLKSFELTTLIGD